ncbi:MAG: copper resistance protein B [Pseudomonadota bacterium]|nr:copper resistance protein B [Pseudomonadota bacterium]
MNNFSKLFIIIFALSFSTSIHAAMDDDPIIFSIKVDEFEWLDKSDGNAFEWGLEAWVGKDRDKLWLKSEGERMDDETEEFDIQLLYNRAIATFWDLQIGLRHNFQDAVERDWLVLGFAGEAPGFIHTEASVFLGEGGIIAFHFESSYELFFTQRLSLHPKLEVDWYNEDDFQNRIGAGLASVELGLRLNYAIRRNLMPYIGINWSILSGATANIANLDGLDDSDLQGLVGISWSF